MNKVIKQTVYFLTLVSIVITIISYFFGILHWDSILLFNGINLALLLIIFRWLFEEKQKETRGVELGFDDNFIEMYKKIKEDPDIIKCDLIWCGNYNEGGFFNYHDYFLKELEFIKKHTFTKKTGVRRIIGYSENEDRSNNMEITTDEFKDHIKIMKEVHDEGIYDARISEIRNLELIYTESQSNKGQTFYSALLIFFDSNGKPIWGYFINSKENPNYKEMILSVGKFFQNEWTRAQEIKW